MPFEDQAVSGAMFADLVSALMAPRPTQAPDRGAEGRPKACGDVGDAKPAPRPEAPDSHGGSPAEAEAPQAKAKTRSDRPVEAANDQGVATATATAADSVPTGEDGAELTTLGTGAPGQGMSASGVVPNTQGLLIAAANANTAALKADPIAAASQVLAKGTNPGDALGGTENAFSPPDATAIVQAVPVAAASDHEVGSSSADANNSALLPAGSTANLALPQSQVAARAGGAKVTDPARGQVTNRSEIENQVLSARNTGTERPAGLADLAPNQVVTAAEDGTAPQARTANTDPLANFNAAPPTESNAQSATPDDQRMPLRAPDPTPVAGAQAPGLTTNANALGALRQIDNTPRHVAAVDQVAIQIRHAATTGLDKIRIELWPEHLGRVDVQLEIDKSGSIKALILTDRPETLDLLQRDARTLDRALQDAGLRTDSNSLQFAAHDRSDRGHQRDDNATGSSHAQSFADDQSGDGAKDPAPIVLRLNRTGLLDIQV